LQNPLSLAASIL
jgi:hypothetical protein